MSVGDRVRVVRVSPHLREEIALYEKCVGKTFAVEGFDGDGWVEIDVGSVTGRPFELITIEPECLEVVSGAAA
ncbi:MAG: hypothetical protein RL328_2542 [Acidobacteriota bacterium]